MAAPTPNELSINDELSYLLNFNNLYIGHLNSVFNFFVVFSALIINALAFVLKGIDSFPSYMDEGIILFSILISMLFFVLDRRTRQIVFHVEASILHFETNNMGSFTKYLRDLPNPPFCSLARHGIVFPIIYLSFSALMFALLFLI